MARTAKPARRRTAEELIAIRGVRGGLLFVLADDAPLAELLAELARKLQTAQANAPARQALTVYFEVGARSLTEEDEAAIRQAVAAHGNVDIGGFDGMPPLADWRQKETFVHKGTVRSGQVLEHDGDIVVIGDVNPGAKVIAAGDVYVMGHLRGSASAGAAGDRTAVVAAAYFEPLQVAIAGVARRAPEKYRQAAEMEFAYLDGEMMAVERMSFLPQHRGRAQLRREAAPAT